MDMLESIKTELDRNDLLLEDFPEVVYPIQCLDGIANRCSGQLYQGQRTRIGWTAREVVLPTIPGSKASAAIIKVAGITGRIRGMKFKRPTATRSGRRWWSSTTRRRTSRPGVSPSAPRGRASWPVLCWAWPGPGKKIAGVMPCTVIRPEDMADRILDRDKHPQWQGERTKMVYTFPTNDTLWAKYAEDPCRKPPGRAWAGRRHGVLPSTSGGNGCRCHDRLAGAVQLR